MTCIKHLLAAALSLLLYLLSSNIAFSMIIIRDDEIESFIYDIAKPIFDTAGLNSSEIQVYIVQDPTLNAFVANNKKLFLHTGLISELDDVSALIGVIAHEAGHIAEGHFLKMSDNLIAAVQNMTLTSIAAILAGAAANSPEVTAGIILGQYNVQHRLLLSYSRTQEYAADRASAKYLAKLGVSMQPMIDLLKKIAASNDGDFYSKEGQYLATHPSSVSRINALQSFITPKKQQPVYDYKDLQRRYELLNAKLKCFAEQNNNSCNNVINGKNAEATKYANAINYYNHDDTKMVLAQIDELMRINPKSPYYNELKGDVFYKNGNFLSAVSYYKKALKLQKDSSKFVNGIRLQLAVALLAVGDKHLISKALSSIHEIVVRDSKNIEAFKQLSIAYFKLDNEYMANLALAKNAILKSDKSLAKRLLKIAECSKHSINDNKQAKIIGIDKDSLSKDLDVMEQS